MPGSPNLAVIGFATEGFAVIGFDVVGPWAWLRVATVSGRMGRIAHSKRDSLNWARRYVPRMAEEVTPTGPGGGVVTSSAVASAPSGWGRPQGPANAFPSAPEPGEVGEVHLTASDVTALAGEVNGWLLDIARLILDPDDDSLTRLTTWSTESTAIAPPALEQIRSLAHIAMRFARDVRLAELSSRQRHRLVSAVVWAVFVRNGVAVKSPDNSAPNRLANLLEQVGSAEPPVHLSPATVRSLAPLASARLVDRLHTLRHGDDVAVKVELDRRTAFLVTRSDASRVATGRLVEGTRIGHPKGTPGTDSDAASGPERHSALDSPVEEALPMSLAKAAAAALFDPSFTGFRAPIARSVTLKGRAGELFGTAKTLASNGDPGGAIEALDAALHLRHDNEEQAYIKEYRRYAAALGGDPATSAQEWRRQVDRGEATDCECWNLAIWHARRGHSGKAIAVLSPAIAAATAPIEHLLLALYLATNTLSTSTGPPGLATIECRRFVVEYGLAVPVGLVHRLWLKLTELNGGVSEAPTESTAWVPTPSDVARRAQIVERASTVVDSPGPLPDPAAVAANGQAEQRTLTGVQQLFESDPAYALTHRLWLNSYVRHHRRSHRGWLALADLVLRAGDVDGAIDVLEEACTIVIEHHSRTQRFRHGPDPTLDRSIASLVAHYLKVGLDNNRRQVVDRVRRSFFETMPWLAGNALVAGLMPPSRTDGIPGPPAGTRPRTGMRLESPKGWIEPIPDHVQTAVVEVNPGRVLRIELRLLLDELAPGSGYTPVRASGQDRRVGVFLDYENLHGRKPVAMTAEGFATAIHDFAESCGSVVVAKAAASPWRYAERWPEIYGGLRLAGFDVVKPPEELESYQGHDRRDLADFTLLQTIIDDVRDHHLDMIVLGTGDVGFYQAVKHQIGRGVDVTVFAAIDARSGAWSKLPTASSLSSAATPPDGQRPGTFQIVGLDEVLARRQPLATAS